jgi:hypothetical protein
MMGFPSPVVAGTPGSFTVTVLDPFGNTVTGYTGTVHFSSSDRQANLSDDYTFTADDQGTHPFSATLFTAGSQSLTARDVAHFLSGTQDGVVVTPAAAVQFQISAPATAASGIPFDVTVTALDPYGNVDTNYSGTGTFTISDPDPAVVLPPDYAFQPSDQGVVTFAGGVMLVTLGDQQITVTDTTSGITGSVTVTVTAGPLPHQVSRLSDLAAVAAPGPVPTATRSSTAAETGTASWGWERGGVDRFFAAAEAHPGRARSRWQAEPALGLLLDPAGGLAPGALLSDLGLDPMTA